MDAPDFPGYEQLINGVYRRNLEPSIDEVIILLRAYIPTKKEVLEYIIEEAKKVELTPDFDENIVSKLEYEKKHTQAMLYALPMNVLQDLQIRDEECLDYIDKFLPDPRSDSEGYEWYLDITCGNIPDTMHFGAASEYIPWLLGLDKPYGKRWFIKVYLEDFLPCDSSQEQHLIAHGLYNLKHITTTIGNIFSEYKTPEHVRALQDVSHETIQLPATWPLNRILLEAHRLNEYIFSQEINEKIN